MVNAVWRRYLLFPRRIRAQWMALLPLATAAAVLEPVAGAVVYVLIAVLSGSPGAGLVLPWLGNIGDALASPPASRSTLAILAVAVAGIHLLKNALLLAIGFYRARVAGESAAALAAMTVRTYLTAPYTFHLRRNSADLVQNVLGGIPAICETMHGVLTLVTEVLVVMGLLLLVARIAPLETTAAAVGIATVLALFIRFTHRLYGRWGERRHELSSSIVRDLQQAFGAIKEVKVLGREPFFYESVARQHRARTRLEVNQGTLDGVPRLLAETAFVIGMLAIVLLLRSRSEDGSGVLPFIGLYAYAGFRILPAAHRIALHTSNIRVNVALSDALARDFQVLGPAPSRLPAAAPAAARLTFRDAIALERVSYVYEDARAPVLRELDLRIERGESVGIVGATGAGKSTLVDLMLGLLSPTRGRMTVDGRDVREDLSAWQRHIGYVPQSPLLLDDTIRRNIAVGLVDAEIEDERVRHAVRVAQLDDLVRLLPEGLETLVGERGIRLSGGERQRLSIARALYHDPELIVFDEATSALDPATERELTRAIEAFRGRKTLLIIAHRLSTVAACDRLLLLQEGRIAAEGSYEQLLRTSTAFRALAAL